MISEHEFRRLAASVLGTSRPTEEAARLIAEARREILSRVAILESAGINLLALVGSQGSLEVADFQRVAPTSPISASVSIPAQSVLVGASQVQVVPGSVPIPRPGDVLDEILGAVPASGGGFSPIIFEVGSPIESAPVAEVSARRDSGEVLLVSGVDYDLDLALGLVEILPGATLIQGGDRIRLRAALGGAWTASVSVGPSGIPFARRGFAFTPDRTWPEVRGPILGEVLLGAVRSISSGLAGIEFDRIDLRARDYGCPTTILDLIDSIRGHRHRRFMPLDGPPVPRPASRTVIVDPEHGDDPTALRGDDTFPFKTIGSAISVALSGDVVFLRPGSHATSGLTIPSGVAIRGASLAVTKIESLGVATDTTLVTMGKNTRLEDVTLTLTSSGHHTLTGVLFPETTSATAKVRTSVVIVDNSGAGAGTSQVVACLSTSTGDPGRETSAIRATTLRVTSSGDGKKRGLLHTGNGTFIVRDVNCRSIGGTDSIGTEVDGAGTLGLDSGSFQGDTADWSQTSGTLRVNYALPVNANANGKSFTADATSSFLGFGDPGGVPPNSTRFFYFGNEQSTGEEVFYRMPRNSILKRMVARARVAPGGTASATIRVRRNGENTALLVVLSGSDTSDEDATHSETFQAGDDLSISVVSTVGSQIEDLQIGVEAY